jgi:hypothetical protein
VPHSARRSRASAAQSDNRPRRLQLQPQARATTTDRSAADEDFDLNIQERRITEQNFFASTEISVRDTSGAVIELTLDTAGKIINSRVVSQATGTTPRQ